MASGAKQALKGFVRSLPLGRRLIELVRPDHAANAVTLPPTPFGDENRAELERLEPGDTVYFTYSRGGLLVGAKYEGLPSGAAQVSGEIALVREGKRLVLRVSGVPRTHQDRVRTAIAGVCSTRIDFADLDEDDVAEEDLATGPLTDDGEPPAVLAGLWAAHDPDRATAAWRSEFRSFAQGDPLVGFLDAVLTYRAAPRPELRDAINRRHLNALSAHRVKVEPEALLMFSALPRTADAADLDELVRSACNQYSRYDEFTRWLAARDSATEGEGSGDLSDLDESGGYEADDEWNIEGMQAIVVDLDAEDGRRAPPTPEQRRNLRAARERLGPGSPRR